MRVPSRAVRLALHRSRPLVLANAGESGLTVRWNPRRTSSRPTHPSIGPSNWACWLFSVPEVPIASWSTVRQLGTTLNSDLLRAIADKRIVEFVYKTGRTRLAEPHDYGIRRGVERLLVFQLRGDSQSGASRGWKELDVAQIRQLRVTEHLFAGTR